LRLGWHGGGGQFSDPVENHPGSVDLGARQPLVVQSSALAPYAVGKVLVVPTHDLGDVVLATVLIVPLRGSAISAAG
jgi:hypothetical protein